MDTLEFWTWFVRAIGWGFWVAVIGVGIVQGIGKMIGAIRHYLNAFNEIHLWVKDERYRQRMEILNGNRAGQKGQTDECETYPRCSLLDGEGDAEGDSEFCE